MSPKIFSCEYVAIEHITQTASNNIFFMVAHFFFYMSVKKRLCTSSSGNGFCPHHSKFPCLFKVLCLISVLPMFRVCTAWRCFTKYTLQIYRFLQYDSFHEHYFLHIFSRFFIQQVPFRGVSGTKSFSCKVDTCSVPPFPSVRFQKMTKRKEQMSGT